MPVDIAIITILDEEYYALDQRFKPKPQRYASGRTYGIASVPSKGEKYYTVAIATSSEDDNDASQQLTNDIIRDLDPSIILVVGIGQGVPHDEFTLGDVIISSRIHNFNAGAFVTSISNEFDIKGGIHPLVSDITANLLLYMLHLDGWNSPGSIGQIRPKLLLKRAFSLIDTNSMPWNHKILTSQVGQHDAATIPNRPPIFKVGSIASSSMQVHNIGLLVQWLQNVRGILAVETSTAGVYQAAQRMRKQYPVMAIRGISDIVGLEGDPLWREYACQTAATFTYAFITTGIFDVSIDENKSMLVSATANTPVMTFPISARTEKVSATELETAVEPEQISSTIRSLISATTPPTSRFVSKQYMLMSSFREHTGWVRCVAFSPDGRYLASSGDDGTIRLWEVSTGSSIHTLKGYANVTSGIAFSPDGRYLASGSDDGTIKLWEFSTGKIMQTLQGHTDWVSCVAFGSDGHYLASGSDDRTIKLWEVPSGRIVHTLEGDAEIYSVAFSPDRRLIAGGSLGKTINVWEISTGKTVYMLKEHGNIASSVAFSPNGDYLASSSENGSIKLWEISTGKVICRLAGHSGWIRCVMFSPDSQLLASGGDDQMIKLWEVSTGRLVQTLTKHTDRIECVVFSPGGQLIASGGRDKTISLWKVSTCEIA